MSALHQPINIGKTLQLRNRVVISALARNRNSGTVLLFGCTIEVPETIRPCDAAEYGHSITYQTGVRLLLRI